MVRQILRSETPSENPVKRPGADTPAAPPPPRPRYRVLDVLPEVDCLAQADDAPTELADPVALAPLAFFAARKELFQNKVANLSIFAIVSL
jgi:hypothetical protein